MPMKPNIPRRLLLESSERTLVIEEKDNGLYSISEGLDGDYHVVSMSRTELIMTMEMILGQVIM
ncbi:hypothetical protein [Bacillus sp. AFS075034]|uniref:hypothetical protein n=1 Tax=Bacillus sp. AFS075034 TaxID=2034281 RepID=UPI000BF79668|nr:hypothetical protein [Bacillus sp. AFS075034]PFW63017.1 hypothetical protein COL20_10365 [Bacillus sp. AFS075034]